MGQPQIVEEKTTSDVNDLFYNAPAALTNSLAQLPNVASTVFSTFSNIIKGSPRYEPNNPIRESSELTDGFTIPSQNPIDYNIYAPTAPPAEEPKVIQPPPTFYSATDSVTPKRPEIPTGNNSYRLTNVKKTYAKIPGLFTGGAPLIPNKIESQQPIPTSEYNYDSYQQQQQPPPPPQESGKFSLSTFFPTGIIDKLQQTVYGESTSQSTDTLDNSVANYPPPPQQAQGYFDGSSNIQGFFGGSQTVPPPTPPRQTTPFEVSSVSAFVPQFQTQPAPTQPVPAFVPQFQQQTPAPFTEVQFVPAFVPQFQPTPTPPRQATPLEVQSVPAFAPQFQPQPAPFEAPVVQPFQQPITGFAPTPFATQGSSYGNQQSFFTPPQTSEIPTPVTSTPFDNQSTISGPPSIPVGLPPSSLPTTGDRQNPYSIRGKKTLFNKNPHIETSAQPFSELLSSPVVNNPVNYFNPCPETEEKPKTIPEVQSFFHPIKSEPELTTSTPQTEVEQFSEFPGLSSATSLNLSQISPVSNSFFSPTERQPEPFNNFFKPIVPSESVEQLSEFPGISSVNSFNSNLISPVNQSRVIDPSEIVLPEDSFDNFFQPIVESESVQSETEVEQFSEFPGLSSRNSFDSNLISEIGDSTINTEIVGDINLEEAETLSLLQQTSSILQHDLNKGENFTLF